MSRRDEARMKTFSDSAAEFVPAVERVFGIAPRILDGARAVLVGDVKLALEAGERELWLIELRGALEHRLGMVDVHGDVEAALREAKERLDG
jgi:acetyl-CoA acetyltransferase